MKPSWPDKRTPGFKQADPAHADFQYLEDLACAYWHSQVLFTAIELEIFSHLDRGVSIIEELAEKTASQSSDLFRLLRSLEKMALIGVSDGHWYNAQAASVYLVPGKSAYMGDFFLYRQYMRPNWEKLSEKLTCGPADESKHLTYKERNLLYVRSTDTLVRQKALQISDLFDLSLLSGPVLDVGGAAGSMLRVLLPDPDRRDAVLFDLEETIDAAKQLYPEPEDWQGIRTLAGDFRTFPFTEKFGTVILSNFLHAYGEDEAGELLEKAVSLLMPDGRIIIHDYFPDLGNAHPQKGALYDLAMMLNTYNGACHEAGDIIRRLEDMGMKHIETADLNTDSSVIAAGGAEPLGISREPWVRWAAAAGFDCWAPVRSVQIETAPWVQLKCRFGCGGYGKGLQCPPRSMPWQETRQLLDSYSRGILVQGAPPGRSFHTMLLEFEKQAFLNGYHKALVFGAGPCPVCPPCPEDGVCRNPEKARPAMESCGIDVYSITKRAGIPLKPVREKGGYVKYIGLLMLE